jgi:plastocyanin domain-containing protein
MNIKAIIGISCLALTLLGCSASEQEPVTSTIPPPKVEAPFGDAQKLTVTVDNGFSPATLEVKAGQPVEITFDTKKRSCATEVIFDELGIKEPLNDGKASVVKFTPSKAGTYAYACPMKMMKGEIVAK